MGVGVNSGLRHAPDWTPHRLRVQANDPAVPSAAIVKAHGMAAEPYEDVFADVKITGGAVPSVDIELLIWSEQSQRFLPFSTAVKVTALLSSKIIKFNTGGARFFLHVSGTLDGAQVDIHCAGLNPVQLQSA